MVQTQAHVQWRASSGKPALNKCACVCLFLLSTLLLTFSVWSEANDFGIDIQVLNNQPIWVHPDDITMNYFKPLLLFFQFQKRIFQIDIVDETSVLRVVLM